MFNGNEKQHPAPFLQVSLCWTELLRVVCHAHPGRPVYLKTWRLTDSKPQLSGVGKPLCNTPFVHRNPPADPLSSLSRQSWQRTELSLISHPAGWEKLHLSATAHHGLSDPLPDNAEDAIPQHHIPCCSPCPEAGIWPPSTLGWAVKQPSLSQNSFSQYVSPGENLKKSSCFQVEFIQKMVSVSTNSRKSHLIKRNLPISIYCYSKSFIKPCSI